MLRFHFFFIKGNLESDIKAQSSTQTLRTSVSESRHNEVYGQTDGQTISQEDGQTEEKRTYDSDLIARPWRVIRNSTVFMQTIFHFHRWDKEMHFVNISIHGESTVRLVKM